MARTSWQRLTGTQRQFVKFLAVGVLNSAAGYSIFAVLILCRLEPGGALLIATVAGMVFNYFSTGRLVFAVRGLGRLPYFAAIYGLTFFVNLWSLKTLIAAGLSAIVAQAVLLPLMVVLNFTLNRMFVFRP